MKDFFKIFAVLSVFIFAFMFGRNYGENQFRSSEEFQSLLKKQTASDFNNNKLSNIRAKFQNIADTSAIKKPQELLRDIFQVLTDDLNVSIIDQADFVKPLTKPIVAVEIKRDPQTESAAPIVKRAISKNALTDRKKFSSYEWMLTNSQNRDEVKNNLKHIEINDIDQFLKMTKPASPSQLTAVYGSYRGRVFDVNKNEFATMAIEMNPATIKEKDFLVGSVKMYKNGKETMSNQFSTEKPGYAIDNSQGFIIDQGARFFQVYKIAETNQIAGFFYERLPRGTTKTIGNFVLNRVDQF